jgi:hypothetical protein
MSANGGHGGGLTGGVSSGPYWVSDWQGKGGTQSAGGAAGSSAGSGALGIGGRGMGNSHGGGGGGGGYFGGGGGTIEAGGGGSSFAHATLAADVSHTQGYSLATSDGSISITYLALPTVSSFSATSALSNSLTNTFSLNFGSSVDELSSSDFTATGTAGGCSISVNGSTGTSFTVTATCQTDGTIGLTLNASSVYLTGNSDLRGPPSAAVSSETLIDRGPPNLTLTAPSTPNKSATLNFALGSTEMLTGLTASDFSVAGTSCVVGTPSAAAGSAPDLVYTIPVGSCADEASVTLTMNQLSVTDAATNAAPASALTAGPVLVDRTAPSGTITSPAASRDDPITFSVTVTETIQGTVDADDFNVSGTGCTIGAITQNAPTYSVTLVGCSDGVNAGLEFKTNTLTDLAGNQGPSGGSQATSAQTSVDRSLSTVTITSPASPNSSTDLTFTANFGEVTNGVSENDFSIVSSEANSCAIQLFSPSSPRDALSGNFSVVLTGCADGDSVALRLKPNSVQDDLGNVGPTSEVISNTVVVDRSAPVLLSVDALNPALSSQSSVVYSVTFNESVTGLTAGMFTLGGGTACSGAAITGSASTYTVTFTGCANGNSVVLNYNITSAVTDLANNAFAGQTSTLTAIVIDTVAPTIASIAKVTGSASVLYTVDFSEEVIGFSSAAITLAGTSTTGSTWTISGFVQQSLTRYQFSITNPLPDSGSVSFTINTSLTTDLALNALAAGSIGTPNASEVVFYFLPTVALGALPNLGAAPNAIAPNLEIDGRGNTLYGIRVSISGVVAGDQLAFTNNDATAFGTIQSASSTNGVLNLTYSGSLPTEAQWQNAARAVKFSTSFTGSASRTVSFHILPKDNYSLDSGHFYEVKA